MSACESSGEGDVVYNVVYAFAQREEKPQLGSWKAGVLVKTLLLTGWGALGCAFRPCAVSAQMRSPSGASERPPMTQPPGLCTQALS